MAAFAGACKLKSRKLCTRIPTQPRRAAVVSEPLALSVELSSLAQACRKVRTKNQENRSPERACRLPVSDAHT